MINYVLFEVSLHNVEGEDLKAVKLRVESLLRKEFKPEYDVDIEVELIESA
jgi:hypothetical protein